VKNKVCFYNRQRRCERCKSLGYRRPDDSGSRRKKRDDRKIWQL